MYTVYLLIPHWAFHVDGSLQCVLTTWNTQWGSGMHTHSCVLCTYYYNNYAVKTGCWHGCLTRLGCTQCCHGLWSVTMTIFDLAGTPLECWLVTLTCTSLTVCNSALDITWLESIVCTYYMERPMRKWYAHTLKYPVLMYHVLGISGRW